jgi:dipeptidyl aminopeptidase/acylaminoacyl peptidase
LKVVSSVQKQIKILKKMKREIEVRQHSRWMFAMITVAVFITAGMMPAASFAANPDFTGTWKLNQEKSKIGEMRNRPASELEVKQDKSSLTVIRTRIGRNGQERKMESSYSMDGKETTSQGGQRSTTSTVKWSEDGSSLIIHSKSSWTREGETYEFKTDETWSLGGDGKILTIQAKSSGSRGEFSHTAVYDRVK